MMARKPAGGPDGDPNGGPNGGRGGGFQISREDRDLWRQVTRDAEPMAKPGRPARPARAPTPEVPAPEAPVAERKAPRKAEGAPARARPRPEPPEPPEPRKQVLPELRHGTIAGVDRRSAERLKRGKLAIEATLDLHGHTQAAAHRELDAFLAEGQARALRCVLVITGKGTTKETGGVLRAQVPKWLNQAPTRARILAFAHAQPQHGGLGALYVLLRRTRGR